MENLVKQMRVRFSGAETEKKEEGGSTRDRRLQPQRAESFKGERRKPQSWFRRQFSRQTSRDYDFSDSEYSAAVAAAAFAVNSLEESSIPDQKKPSEGPTTSFTKIKSKIEDKETGVPEPPSTSRRLSGEASMTDLGVPDERVPITAATDGKEPAKAIEPAPSIKKTPTFADLTGIKPESSLRKPFQSTKQSESPPTEVKRQSSKRTGIGESKAEEWEKTQMSIIKERYEKLQTTILDWENKRKMKAKRKLDRTESELEKRRARSLQRYRREMESIDQIAGGARNQAEKNRRNEERRAKEKADKIRATGKVPATCFCF